MNSYYRGYSIFSSIWAFFGVALGAFGAHALKSSISANYLETWETAVFYHLIHAIGILVISITSLQKVKILSTALACLSIGTVIFSGSLYLLVLTNITKLGLLTPIGGVSLLMGWATLALYFYKRD